MKKWLFFYGALMIIAIVGGWQIGTAIANTINQRSQITNQDDLSQLTEAKKEISTNKLSPVVCDALEIADQKIIKVEYTKTKLIDTVLDEDDPNQVTEKAVTITFKENFFGDGDTCVVSKNGVDWNAQTEVLIKKIEASKLFSYSVVEFKNYRILLIPTEKKHLYKRQTNWLIYQVQKLFKVKLIHSKKG